MKIRASTLTGLFALAGALVVLPAAASPDKAVARAASGAAA